MDLDQYAKLMEDHRMDLYLQALPSYVREQLMDGQHRPGTYEEMVAAAEEIRKERKE